MEVFQVQVRLTSKSMRDMQDRRGGGLMLVCKKDNMEANMKSTRIKDILHAEMTVELWKIWNLT